MPTPYNAATQDALLGRSTPNPVYRRIAAVILLLLMAVVVFFATGLRTVGGLTNNVTISNIVISASIEDPTATALANAMLSDIRGHIPPHEYAAFDAHHDLFVTTILATAKDPATQAIIRGDVREAFILLDTGKNGTVDFTPLLRQFTSALHQADAAFPNNPDLIAPKAVLTLKPNGTSYPIGSSLLTTGVDPDRPQCPRGILNRAFSRPESQAAIVGLRCGRGRSGSVRRRRLLQPDPRVLFPVEN